MINDSWNVTTWRVCLCCFGQCTSYKDCRNAMPGRTNLESKHLRQQAGFFVVCCRLQWILNLVSFLVSLCPVFIIKNREKMSNQLKSFWPEIHANLLQFFPSGSRRTLQLNWLFRCLNKWGELNIFTVVSSSCKQNHICGSVTLLLSRVWREHRFFSPEITAAVLVHRAKEKEVFWEFELYY